MTYKSLNSKLRNEFEEKQKVLAKTNELMKLLKTLTLLSNGKTNTKQNMRDALGINEGEKTSVTNETLKKAYYDLVEKLNCKHASESQRTIYEINFAKQIKKYTRRKFYQSVWIQNHCVDFFFPQLKLVVELNGGIHNVEYKMRKDDRRDCNLEKLGIKVHNLDNEYSNTVVFEIIRLIKDSKTIGSTNLKRLWRNIYIATLACHIPLSEVGYKFNYDFEFLENRINNKKAIAKKEDKHDYEK